MLQPHILIARLQGSVVPENALVKVFTLAAGLDDAASIESPDKIQVKEKTMTYMRDLTIVLDPYYVVVVEVTAN